MKNIFKTYIEVLKICPYSGLFCILFCIFNGLFDGIITELIIQLFDSLNFQGTLLSKTTYKFGSFIVIIYGVKLFLQIIYSVALNAYVFEKCTMQFRINIFEKFSRLSLIDYEKIEILNLKKMAMDCCEEECLSLSFMKINSIISSVVSISSVVIVLAEYSYIFILICILSVIPYFITKIIRQKKQYMIKERMTKQERKLQYIFKLFTDKRSIKEFRVMNCEKYIIEKWSALFKNVNNKYYEQEKRDNIFFMISELICSLGYVSSVVVSFILVIKSTISIGVMSGCINAFLNVQESMKIFLNNISAINKLSLYINNYYRFLSLEDNLCEYEKCHKNLVSLYNSITLENISFSYPSADKLALNNINTCIKKGEKVLILGQNGSGKSTLVKIILGMYKPESGTVFYDGISLEESDLQSLYKKVSIVTQNFINYKLTVRENIAISDIENINDSTKIADKMELADIEQLRDCIDSQVGREFDGIEFSGGQWQRIAIARAMFKDSELVCMDEPTSALDPIEERKILLKFIDMMRGKTSIIVSHRVGLSKYVDKIIIMEEGRIVGIGTHDTLINDCLQYKELYISQSQWYI